MNPKTITAMQRASRFGPLDWAFKDLTGARFGRLIVLARIGTDIGGHARWLARCDCGRFTTVDGTSLRLKRTVSCGCYMNERRKVRPVIRSLSRWLNRLTLEQALELARTIAAHAGGVSVLEKLLPKRTFLEIKKADFQSKTNAANAEQQKTKNENTNTKLRCPHR